MNSKTFRFTLYSLLAGILYAVADESLRRVLLNTAFIVACAYAVAAIVVFVWMSWDGDRDIDDWLDPGSTRRKPRYPR